MQIGRCTVYKYATDSFLYASSLIKKKHAALAVYKRNTILISVQNCTDKKENQIFLIYKEIQNGSVAKSYMTNCLLIYLEIFAHFLIN